jgi:hypothetical protein
MKILDSEIMKHGKLIMNLGREEKQNKGKMIKMTETLTKLEIEDIFTYVANERARTTDPQKRERMSKLKTKLSKMWDEAV